MIGPARERALRERMARLGVKDAELIEKFTAGSGPGGQKINKTASCVYLRHPPTGIEIQCQENRSRSVNRYLARVRLCDRIESDRENRRLEKNRRRASDRYRKRRRSAAQKRRLRELKSRRSDRKRNRRRITGGDD